MPSDPYKSITFGNSLSLRVDGAIGAMSLAPNGRDAVLAGRRGLFIIDLDDPFTTPRWLHHITSWEVADVQWSPHHNAKPSWCISTSNQKALLWDLARPSNNAIANVLHKHTRAITDINFHPLDPEMLATCSIDTHIYSWDMRAPRRPVGKWAEWRAGANQVKWNHGNPHQLASSHDHGFYIWDSRFGATPLVRVEHAHSGKINGLDFGVEGGKILTCSNDKTVKLWNTQDPEFDGTSPLIILKTDFPIARARCLPFGNDKSCGLMPVRGGEDAVHIANFQLLLEDAVRDKDTKMEVVKLAYSFTGHQGSIKDFLWRTLRHNYKGYESRHPWDDYQLVTWSSQDFDLKLWPHDDDLYKSVNYNPLHQKILSSLAETAYLSDNEDVSRSHSPSQSPGGDASSKEKETLFKYETYCVEPSLAVADLTDKNTSDPLSALTYFKLKESHNYVVKNAQVNHLNWISGVRIGQTGAGRRFKSDTDGPNNLGEEVSLVGHKFPKVRFEEISVSTGYLMISLRGPRPQQMITPRHNPTASDPQKPKSLHEDNSSSKSKILAANATSRHTSASNHQLSLTITKENINTPSEDSIQQNIHQKESLEVPMSTEGSADQSLIFIRLKIKFPKNYPFLEDFLTQTRKEEKKSQSPKKSEIFFDIEETHELSASIKDAMIVGLNEIAYFYSHKYNKFCLEPCLRFLLGDRIYLDDDMIADKESREADAENVSIEIGDENWVDDLITQHEAARKQISMLMKEELDEEDADIIPVMDDNTNLTEDSSDSDIDLGATKKIGPKHDSTPLPKGCGAVWSRNGDLVCFFLGKHESNAKQSQSKISSGMASKELYDEDTELQNDSYNSSSEEEASIATSEESFSDDWDSLLINDTPSRARVPGISGDHLRMNYAFEHSRNQSTRRPLTSGGLNSSAFEDQSLKNLKRKKSGKTSKNLVSIHNFLHLIPDKMELARVYRVLGDTPENLAFHNSAVAKDCGYLNLGHIWNIVGMILKKNFLFEEMRVLRQECEGASLLDWNTPFFWEHHPFGHLWLIPALFDHFKKRNNVQMLAMLSCIMNENLVIMRDKRHSEFRIPIHTPYSIPPTPPDPFIVPPKKISCNSYGLSSNKIPFNNNQIFEEKRPIRKQSEKSLNHSTIDEKMLYNKKDFLADGRRTTDVNDRLGNEKLISSRSTAFSNKSTKSGLEAKRQIRGVQTRKAFHGSSKTVRGPPAITITMKNTTELDVFEDIYSRPFLGDIDYDALVQYREQYSDLLYIWGLQYNRAKILKFNFSGDSSIGNSIEGFSDHKCTIKRRNRRAFDSSQLLTNPISDIKSAKENSWNSKLRNKIQYCGFCNLQINKRLVACTSCEHVMHAACAADWWLVNDDIEKHQECPTGCGCNCLLHSL